jgi:hypothetical protein
MSAYRGELSGLYASIAIINRLCDFHNITSGEITVGCDGLSALQAIFGTRRKIQTTQDMI